jgi:hypothetical protein
VRSGHKNDYNTCKTTWGMIKQKWTYNAGLSS